jgi:hypothetical protein
MSEEILSKTARKFFKAERKVREARWGLELVGEMDGSVSSK